MERRAQIREYLIKYVPRLTIPASSLVANFYKKATTSASRVSIFQLLNLRPHPNANVSRLTIPASSLVACWWQTEAGDLQAFETPCKLQIGEILNLRQAKMSIQPDTFFSRPDISRIRNQNPNTWFNKYLAMNTSRHLKLILSWTKGWCKPSWHTCTLTPPPPPQMKKNRGSQKKEALTEMPKRCLFRYDCQRCQTVLRWS